MEIKADILHFLECWTETRKKLSDVTMFLK